MGVSARENDLLKLVLPGRLVKVYREPVLAAEIMKKYPRHCIARPDVFQFPWISVRPDSVLVPGRVFYLVPFRTMHKLLEDKKNQQHQNSPRRNQPDDNHDQHQHHPRHRQHPLHRPRQHHPDHRENDGNSPSKAMAGLTPKHQNHNKYYRGETSNSPNDAQEDQESDETNDYWSSFHRSWNSARENLQQDYTNDNSIDSMFGSVVTRIPRARVTSPERIDLRLRSCMRKPNSVRKLLNLKVTFTSPIVVPGTTPRQSPRFQLRDVITP